MTTNYDSWSTDELIQECYRLGMLKREVSP